VERFTNFARESRFSITDRSERVQRRCLSSSRFVFFFFFVSFFVVLSKRKQRLRDELEEEPVDFMARQLYPRMKDALSSLERFVNAEPHSIVRFSSYMDANTNSILFKVFAHNVTMAINIVTKSLLPSLGEHDEVVTSDHEYGACERAFIFSLEQSGGSSNVGVFFFYS
jgi:hypothetical protein